MNKHLKTTLISAFSAILVIAASACTVSAAPPTDISAPFKTATSFNTTMLDISTFDLSTEEIEMLLFMREEEKLARDVYNAMYELWGQPVFQNISASEQKHMDSVKTLLDRYALNDPTLESGSFSDPSLQALYDQLIAQGSISLPEALKVGAAIEEIDILDLEKRIAQTDNTDIQWVFNNLTRGSYNHLKAFTRTLSMQTGETYIPQYLTPEAYTAIVANQNGNGFGNGRQAAGQGGGGFPGGRNGFNNRSQ